MPNICSVVGCKSKYEKDNSKLSMFKFPKDEIYSKQWLDVCKNKNANVKNARICSLHFLPEHFKPLSYANQVLKTFRPPTRRLRDNAIPTENIGEIHKSNTENSKEIKIEFQQNEQVEEIIYYPVDSDISLDSYQEIIKNSTFIPIENVSQFYDETLVVQELTNSTVQKEIEDETEYEKLIVKLGKSEEELKKSRDELEKSRKELEKSRAELKNAEELIETLKIEIQRQSEEHGLELLQSKKREALWKRQCRLYKIEADKATKKS